jgi:fermentation-respiration switch protein FrsA (DUF1100 family)
MAMLAVKLALMLLAIVAFLMLVVRLLEPRLAFFPESGEMTSALPSGLAHTAFFVATSDGEQLRAWTLEGPEPRARIVYFHGNGGNLSIWEPILSGIARERYAVLAFDYRGYGTSSGTPSERGLYRDVQAIVDHAWRASTVRRPVVYWGRSLGSVMAAYAATLRPPDGLILEAGFPDAPTLLRGSPLLAFLSLFSTYRFPTSEFLRQVHAPVLVIHGDKDGIIPFAMGRRLFDGISGNKEFFTISGGDHNDAVPSDRVGYWRAVNAFIAGLPKAAP